MQCSTQILKESEGPWRSWRTLKILKINSKFLQVSSKLLQNFFDSCAFLIFLAALDCTGGGCLHVSVCLAFFGVFCLCSSSDQSKCLTLFEVGLVAETLFGGTRRDFGVPSAIIRHCDLSNRPKWHLSLLILLCMWNPRNSRRRLSNAIQQFVPRMCLDAAGHGFHFQFHSSLQHDIPPPDSWSNNKFLINLMKRNKIFRMSKTSGARMQNHQESRHIKTQPSSTLRARCPYKVARVDPSNFGRWRPETTVLWTDLQLHRG